MASITAVELGVDTCVLVRTSVRRGAVHVLAVETLDPTAFPGLDSFTLAVRQARRALKLPRRCRAVVWGLPDGANRKDLAVQPLLAPLIGAGLKVERVVSPCNALAALARLKSIRGDGATCWLAVNRGGVAIVVVRPGTQLYSYSFAWDSSVGSSGSQARLLQRYSLVAILAPEVKRAMAEARKHGVAVEAVVTCGNLPDLRSLTMPLIEELDVEVETLDSLDGLVVKPAAAERLAEVAPAIRLACAGLIARGTRAWDEQRRLSVRRMSAALRIAAAAALVLGIGIGYAWYMRVKLPSVTAMLARVTDPRPASPAKPPWKPPPAAPPAVSAPAKNAESNPKANPPVVNAKSTPPAPSVPAPAVSVRAPAVSDSAKRAESNPKKPESNPKSPGSRGAPSVPAQPASSVASAPKPSAPRVSVPPPAPKPAAPVVTAPRPAATPNPAVTSPPPSAPKPGAPVVTAPRPAATPNPAVTSPPPAVPKPTPPKPNPPPVSAAAASPKPDPVTPATPTASVATNTPAAVRTSNPPAVSDPAKNPPSVAAAAARAMEIAPRPLAPAPRAADPAPRAADPAPRSADPAPPGGRGLHTPAVTADKLEAARNRPLPPLLKDPLPRVTTILVSSDRRFATIDNGEIIGIGDVLGRRVVVAIDERTVVLREPSGVQIRVGLGGRVVAVGRSDR